MVGGKMGSPVYRTSYPGLQIMRAPKKGDTVRIQICDHIKNADDLPNNYVYGRVHKVTDDTITLDWWAMVDPEILRNLGDEVECITIQRRSIDRISVVAEWKDL